MITIYQWCCSGHLLLNKDSFCHKYLSQVPSSYFFFYSTLCFTFVHKRWHHSYQVRHEHDISNCYMAQICNPNLFQVRIPCSINDQYNIYIHCHAHLCLNCMYFRYYCVVNMTILLMRRILPWRMIPCVWRILDVQVTYLLLQSRVYVVVWLALVVVLVVEDDALDCRHEGFVAEVFCFLDVYLCS